MSDILIKNMKMPARCELCQFSGISGKSCELVSCTFTGKHRYFNGGQYMDGCPLIELPPHGRLIDADAYHKEIRERYESAREWYKGAKTDDIKARAESALFTFTECSLTIRKMPTIIESEVSDGKDINVTTKDGGT